jgi:hypothetical protein
MIDNIFIDITKFENYIAIPVFNGLPDHNGQLLTLHQQEFRGNPHKAVFLHPPFLWRSVS